MALAYVNRGGSATSATAATSVGVTVTAQVGDTIVVAVGTVATAVSSITDNATPANVYVQVAGPSTNTERVSLWISVNIANAPTTVTANFANSRYGVSVETYTGAVGYAQANNSAIGSVSPASIVLGNALASGNWAVAGFANKGTATWSASTGNLRTNNVAGAGTTTPGAAIVDNTTTTCAAAESAGNVWCGCAVELMSVWAKQEDDVPPKTLKFTDFEPTVTIWQ